MVSPARLTMAAALRRHLTSAHSKRTREDYETAVDHWRRITGDPPLHEVDNQTMSEFRERLATTPLPSTGRPPASTTVAKVLRALQAILSTVGPAQHGNPYGLGLIDRIPVCRKPPADPADPVVATGDEVGRIYRAAAGARWPNVEGLSAGDVWQALVVYLFNVGSRRNEFLSLKWYQVDLDRGLLTMRTLKRGRTITRPLVSVVVDHLQRLRVAGGELVFPFPRSRKLIYRTWHRVQQAAGIQVQRPLGSNRRPFYGFHELRKTCSQQLFRISPAAAQRMLGHASLETTRRHYCDADQLLVEATSQVVQPAEFFGSTDEPHDPPPPRATFRIVG